MKFDLSDGQYSTRCECGMPVVVLVRTDEMRQLLTMTARHRRGSMRKTSVAESKCTVSKEMLDDVMDEVSETVVERSINRVIVMLLKETGCCEYANPYEKPPRTEIHTWESPYPISSYPDEFVGHRSRGLDPA